MIGPLYTAFALFGFNLVQALMLMAWRDRVRKEISRSDTSTTIASGSGVTVIVPARNAASTLVALLQDLNAQDLPKALHQVIVVDDHSADDTASVVQGMMLTWPQLTYVLNAGEGKKSAITTGVALATHEHIVLTDADARCDRARSRTILEKMQREDLDLLLLPVRTSGSGAFVQRVQEEEQAGLLGVAAGEALLGRPSLANGANLAFTRSAFNGVEGYSGDRYASGDDVFLVQRMKNAGKHIGYLLDRRVLVTVEAEPTWSAFLQQRLRWAGKMRGVRGGFSCIGMIALLSPWLLLVATWKFRVASIVEENGLETLLFLVLAWLLWMVPAVALVREVRRFLGQRGWLLTTVVSYMLFAVYAPVIAVLSIFIRPKWKGRRV